MVLRYFLHFCAHNLVFSVHGCSLQRYVLQTYVLQIPANSSKKRRKSGNERTSKSRFPEPDVRPAEKRAEFQEMDVDVETALRRL